LHNFKLCILSACFSILIYLISSSSCSCVIGGATTVQHITTFSRLSSSFTRPDTTRPSPTLNRPHRIPVHAECSGSLSSTNPRTFFGAEPKAVKASAGSRRSSSPPPDVSSPPHQSYHRTISLATVQALCTGGREIWLQAVSRNRVPTPYSYSSHTPRRRICLCSTS